MSQHDVTACTFKCCVLLVADLVLLGTRDRQAGRGSPEAHLPTFVVRFALMLVSNKMHCDFHSNG